MADVCETCRAALPAYVAGELPAKELEHVQAHVAACARCRAEATDFRRAHNALQAQEVQAPPANLHAAFSARLAAHHARRQPAAQYLRFAAATGLAVLAIGVGFAFTHRAPVVAVRPPDRDHLRIAQALRPRTDANPRVNERGASAAAHGTVEPATTDGATAARDASDSTPPKLPVKVAERDSESLDVPTVSVRGSHDRRRSPARRVAKGTPSFLDVTDSTGHSARMILRTAGLTVSPKPMEADDNHPAFGEHKPVLVSQVIHERVQVDGREVMISGERGWDARGRLARIRMHVAPTAETPLAPQPASVTPAVLP